MRLYSTFLLIFFTMTVYSQTFNIKTVFLDSLLFETSKFRSCDSVKRFQAEEIKSLGLELTANAVALRLSESKSSTLQGLLSNQKESQNLDFQQYAIDKAKLKRKIRKRNLLIVVETIGLVGLILML